MSIFLAIILIALLSPLTNASNSTKVENIFQPNVTVKAGDIMQCEIKKTSIIEETKNSHKLFSQSCTTETCHMYHAASDKKCFSFKVKSVKNAHIMLSSTPYYYRNEKLEVILEHDQKFSCIRAVYKTILGMVSKTVYLSKLIRSGIINNNEFRGFWIKWENDQIVEVGHESDTIPFLRYKFPEKLQIKFLGIMSWSTNAEWIIDETPNCPSKNDATTSTIQRKMKAESDCFMLN